MSNTFILKIQNNHETRMVNKEKCNRNYLKSGTLRCLRNCTNEQQLAQLERVQLIHNNMY